MSNGYSWQKRIYCDEEWKKMGVAKCGLRMGFGYCQVKTIATITYDGWMIGEGIKFIMTCNSLAICLLLMF